MLASTNICRCFGWIATRRGAGGVAAPPVPGPAGGRRGFDVHRCQDSCCCRAGSQTATAKERAEGRSAMGTGNSAMCAACVPCPSPLPRCVCLPAWPFVALPFPCPPCFLPAASMTVGSTRSHQRDGTNDKAQYARVRRADRRSAPSGAGDPPSLARCRALIIFSEPEQRHTASEAAKGGHRKKRAVAHLFPLFPFPTAVRLTVAALLLPLPLLRWLCGSMSPARADCSRSNMQRRPSR
jgi:hypothetical protein